MSSSYIERRRAKVAEAWNLDSDTVVIIAAGEPIPIPGGQDQRYPFTPTAEYRYLTDRVEPGGVVAFAIADGWTEFVPEVTEAERFWEGREPAVWRERVRPMSEFSRWLTAQRRGGGRAIVTVGALAIEGVRPSDARADELRMSLDEVRRVKDEVELDRMRRAATASAAGFARARETIRPGATERDVQIELEAEMFRHGGDGIAYETIVGAGPNAAHLHHAPGRRVIGVGDLVLIDAGAAVEGYASDVTRTYLSDGSIPGENSTTERVAGDASERVRFIADLYAVVLRAQRAAVAGCLAGAEFRELHFAAARDLTEGLIDLGILRGAVETLVERDAHAMFFPHGLGHLVGLGVRDATGYARGRTRSTRFGLNALRLDLPLHPGYVTTIEPGLYFIPAILNSPERRERYAHDVNWRRVEQFIDIGGVRIEDNILITDGPPDVLTAAIPK